MAGAKRPRKRIMAGALEPVFDRLPESVLDNLRRPASENALLWNLIYPLARPTLSLRGLLMLPPLWGTAAREAAEDVLHPYFWGYSLGGDRLPHLDEAAFEVDGKGNGTQVDLFLAGSHNLVLVEAKHLAGFGGCGRYARGRCPEIHRNELTPVDSCRYWESGAGEFSARLDFGRRPQPESERPPCATHYQLARTLTLGAWLAQRSDLRLRLWVILPRSRWRSVERVWIDFVSRVRNESIWRDCRVLAWEDVRDLAARRG